jgi:hypothetical protein
LCRIGWWIFRSKIEAGKLKNKVVEERLSGSFFMGHTLESAKLPASFSHHDENEDENNLYF